MRLLRLEVENLNALYGAHVIDFQGDLQEAPLFLIHGPTGAGKSTLLDAISLTLFGVTPRLPDRGPREAKDDVSPAQILSRGTAQGRAVLTFAKRTLTGSETYRATWKVWRGTLRTPRPEGNVQGPYRWIERQEADGSWTRLATDYPGEQGRTRDLDAAMDTALEGFSLADFNRCMLLAQGDFAAFLKATEEERGKILERLTRTEEYQQIGARAADRWSAAKAAVNAAEAELGGVQPLDEAALEVLQQERQSALSALEAAQQRVETARTALAWLDREQELTLAREGAQARLAETEAALAEAAPDLERLAAFEGAREALQALETARQAREQLEGRVQEEARLAVEATRCEAQREQLVVEGKAAAEVHRQAQQALLDQTPALREAREARQALAGARTERDQAETRHHEAIQIVQKAKDEASQAERKQAEADLRMAEARQALEAAPWEALARELAGLEAHHRTLQATHDTLGREEKAREALVSEQANLAPTLDGLKATAEALKLRLDALAQEAEAAERERALRLEGQADVAAARRHLDTEATALGRRGEALRDLLRQARALDGSRLVPLTEARTLAQAALEQARTDREAAATHRAEAQAHHDAQARDLDLMRWARDLVQERSKLQTGCPCPLCGSETHPALEDPAQPSRDEAVADACARLAAALDQATQALEAAQEAHRRAEADVVRRETEAQGATRALEAATAEDQATRQHLADLALPLGVAPDLEALDAALADTTRQEAALAQRREALDAAEAAHQEAQKALQEVRMEAQGAEGAVDTARERIKAMDQRLADADARLQDLQAQGAAQAAELAAALTAHGLPDTDPLPEAHRRVKAFEVATEALRTAERNHDAASREAALKAQALDTARQAEAQAAEAVGLRQTQVQEAEARCAAVLGGADPDPIEAALQKAESDAAVQVNRLREAFAKAKEEAGRAQGAWESAQRLVQEARSTREAAESALAAALPPFGTEADLAARALPADEVRALELQRQDLQRAQRDALSRLSAWQEQWEAHAALRPGTTQAADREALQAAQTEAQAEATGHQEAATRAAVALEDQAEARARQAAVMARLEAARRELSLWTRMQTLVGRGEGEAFRRFAQVLNLRDLLAKANARLEKLRPRYRLVPAMGSEGERLAFAVEDTAHAGEVRPVGTLSGGETFLVSLSLALGLADYRTVRMPIETLLLDEGFGTLDPGTLGDVLGTLGSLTSQGTQVGVISHVEALKEKIPARILVEPQGPGRSRVLTQAR